MTIKTLSMASNTNTIFSLSVNKRIFFKIQQSLNFKKARQPKLIHLPTLEKKAYHELFQ